MNAFPLVIVNTGKLRGVRLRNEEKDQIDYRINDELYLRIEREISEYRGRGMEAGEFRRVLFSLVRTC